MRSKKLLAITILILQPFALLACVESKFDQSKMTDYIGDYLNSIGCGDIVKGERFEFSRPPQWVPSEELYAISGYFYFTIKEKSSKCLIGITTSHFTLAGDYVDWDNSDYPKQVKTSINDPVVKTPDGWKFQDAHWD